MQTKTLRKLLQPGSVELLSDDAEQRIRTALQARRKRQRQRRKAGRASR